MPRALHFLAVGVICATGLAGCSSERPIELVPVAGKISLEGQPIRRGVVSLRPDDAGNLHHPTGKIEQDGSYKLFTIEREGAPPGRYKVLVFADANTNPQTGKSAHPAMPQWLVNPRYTALETTDLSLQVVSGAAPGAYDLQLKK